MKGMLSMAEKTLLEGLLVIRSAVILCLRRQPGSPAERSSRRFSPGPLAALASHAGLVEVLTVGMLVPCFTWIVQLGASGLVLPAAERRLYWGDLGRICTARVGRSVACSDRELVSGAGLHFGSRPRTFLAKRGIDGCGPLPQVGPAQNRSHLAAHCVRDDHREHDALSLGRAEKWW